ncbi:hypothetical protein SprV_0301111100 [Sparganum proliferum]
MLRTRPSPVPRLGENDDVSNNLLQLVPSRELFPVLHVTPCVLPSTSSAVTLDLSQCHKSGPSNIGQAPVRSPSITKGMSLEANSTDAEARLVQSLEKISDSLMDHFV